MESHIKPFEIDAKLQGVVRLRGVAHRSDGDAQSVIFQGPFEPNNHHQADSRSAGDRVASSHAYYAEGRAQ